MTEQPARFVDPALTPPVTAPPAAAQQPVSSQAPQDILALLARGFRQQSKTVEMEVDDADGNTWVAAFDATIPYETYQSWLLAASDPTAPTGINQLTLACHDLVHQAKHLTVEGQRVNGADGQPLTFDSPQLQQALGAIDATDCVRRFFRSDGTVILAHQRLMAEAGYSQGPRTR